VEVGLAEEGETAEFDARFFRRRTEDELRVAAADGPIRRSVSPSAYRPTCRSAGLFPLW
jgi:hypothetical protein